MNSTILVRDTDSPPLNLDLEGLPLASPRKLGSSSRNFAGGVVTADSFLSPSAIDRITEEKLDDLAKFSGEIRSGTSRDYLTVYSKPNTKGAPIAVCIDKQYLVAEVISINVAQKAKQLANLAAGYVQANYPELEGLPPIVIEVGTVGSNAPFKAVNSVREDNKGNPVGVVFVNLKRESNTQGFYDTLDNELREVIASLKNPESSIAGASPITQLASSAISKAVDKAITDGNLAGALEKATNQSPEAVVGVFRQVANSIKSQEPNALIQAMNESIITSAPYYLEDYVRNGFNPTPKEMEQAFKLINDDLVRLGLADKVGVGVCIINNHSSDNGGAPFTAIPHVFNKATGEQSQLSKFGSALIASGLNPFGSPEPLELNFVSFAQYPEYVVSRVEESGGFKSVLDGDGELRGTNGGDRLNAKNTGKSTLFGFGGNDVVNGGSGNNELIFGGAGNDRINGNTGDDILYGGSGNDRLRGGAGNDQLVGGTGNDILTGGSGNDKLTGGQGRDRFSRVGNGDLVTDFTREDRIIFDRRDTGTPGFATIHVEGGALSGSSLPGGYRLDYKNGISIVDSQGDIVAVVLPT
jgi:hypothetical protein